MRSLLSATPARAAVACALFACAGDRAGDRPAGVDAAAEDASTGADVAVFGDAEIFGDTATPPDAGDVDVFTPLDARPSVADTAAAPGPLPPGWQARDVGSRTPRGTSSHRDGVFRLESIGLEAERGQDFYHYVHRPLTGDGEIVARIVRVDSYEDGGLAFSYDPGFTWVHRPADGSGGTQDGPYAPGVRLVWVRDQGVTWLARETTRAPGNVWGPAGDLIAAKVSFPVWVRLVRKGQTFTGSYSEDGVTWMPLPANGSGRGAEATLIEAPATIWVGLFLGPHTTNRRVSATFDNVSVRPLR